MPGSFLHSLTFKIGAVIVLVEIVVLAVVGSLYTGRFHSRIDAQVQSRVNLPGQLMNSGLLNIDAVERKETLERLVGQDLVELADGMVVGINGNVFHSLDPSRAGTDIREVPGISPDWFDPSSAPGVVESFSDQGSHYVVSVTPLFVAEGHAAFLFAYVKVNVTRAEEEKAAITRFFALGSFFAVALTSLVIILLFRTTIAARLRDLVQVFRRVESGDMAARVVAPIARDEIGDAQRGLNAMAERLQESIVELTDHVNALEQAHAELEARNAELERFTYTVSHDLKTPLVTIKGFLGLLRQDVTAGDAPRMLHDIEHIDGAADKMSRLLEELLELSRIGRLMNEPEEIALTGLAQQAVDLVSGPIQEKGVQVEIQPGMPAVFGDRTRLLEVFQNLIDNAVKFLGDQSAPRIEIRASARDGEVVCVVRDNGIGIEPRHHERIFGLFNRLDQNTEGTGIGLALVRRILEVHGGSVLVESDGEGHGSTFRVSLPAPDNSAPVQGPPG